MLGLTHYTSTLPNVKQVHNPTLIGLCASVTDWKQRWIMHLNTLPLSLWLWGGATVARSRQYLCWTNHESVSVVNHFCFTAFLKHKNQTYWKKLHLNIHHCNMNYIKWQRPSLRKTKWLCTLAFSLVHVPSHMMRSFSFTFGELSCRPSLCTVYGVRQGSCWPFSQTQMS